MLFQKVLTETFLLLKAVFKRLSKFYPTPQVKKNNISIMKPIGVIKLFGQGKEKPLALINFWLVFSVTFWFLVVVALTVFVMFLSPDTAEANPVSSVSDVVK